MRRPMGRRIAFPPPCFMEKAMSNFQSRAVPATDTAVSPPIDDYLQRSRTDRIAMDFPGNPAAGAIQS
jgi:hypothetical protein